ncbi:unnamed protein product [Thelazia callipaeda]|uniref:CaMBD domain-containing protein n=1 Tax=Thelazia callipaeda TaxID=103827 RepID=A0A0N5CNB9_THECL|nr:unnamed protein product [Thelazia callipaeda]
MHTRILENTKSFDYSSACARDTNALIKVSTDLLRLYGNRQRFRNLLTSRQKLGSLPSAYTKIDDGNGNEVPISESDSWRNNAPKISQNINNDTQGSFILSNLYEIKWKLQSSTTKPSICSSLSPSQSLHNEQLENGEQMYNNSPNRNGLQVENMAASYQIRSKCLKKSVQLNDRCVILALIGVLFMIIDNEVTAQPSLHHSKDCTVSLVLRSIVACSTLILLTQIFLYHINEIKLEMFDCGSDDWRVVVSFENIAQVIFEIIACAICPFPGTGYINWTFMKTDQIHQYITTKQVPVDIILSLLMLIRVYLIARFMVLHSKQFQDASTRTLAALNQIQVNFSFVMKTILDQHPVAFLTTFTIVFWIISAWTFAQCERYGQEESILLLYSNALWFIGITFMLNGYGDLVPHTHCGRAVALTVGVVQGAAVSSIMIAVISRKMLLSEAQRNVNNFMNDSRLSKEYKDAAARVLQNTWHIYKCFSSWHNTNRNTNSILRQHQRKFLKAIKKYATISVKNLCQ